MPRVTESWNDPNGLPNASTVSPGFSVEESPHCKYGRLVPSILITARSSSLSTPTTFAFMIRRSCSVTFTCTAPSTTWSLVTIYPSGEMMTPLPMPCSSGCCCCWKRRPCPLSLARLAEPAKRSVRPEELRKARRQLLVCAGRSVRRLPPSPSTSPARSPRPVPRAPPPLPSRDPAQSAPQCCCRQWASHSHSPPASSSRGTRGSPPALRSAERPHLYSKAFLPSSSPQLLID